MQFIDPHNDTLAISNPENVYSILLNNNIFFFDKAYFQVIESSNGVKLTVSRKVSYQAIEIGALGLPNYTGSGIQGYTSFVTSTGDKKLVMNEDVEITSETAYFLINHNKEFDKANKPSFIKAFPHSEEKIGTYLKQNKIDFNKQADLQKLFVFCVAQN